MELAKCRLCGATLYKTDGPICFDCLGTEPIVDVEQDKIVDYGDYEPVPGFDVNRPLTKQHRDIMQRLADA